MAIRGPGLRAWMVLMAAAIAGLCLGAPAPGQSIEYEVKAAMLYNFTRFVEWPATAWKDARAPMVVGVLGENPFGPVLEQALRGKNYSGRPIQVRQLHSVAEAGECQLLFIAKSERKRLAEILRAAQSSATLTVSDMDEFVRAGGAIGFVLMEGRIRFEINNANATRAGLTISSKLLRLAVAGERGGRP